MAWQLSVLPHNYCSGSFPYILELEIKHTPWHERQAHTETCDDGQK